MGTDGGGKEEEKKRKKNTLSFLLDYFLSSFAPMSNFLFLFFCGCGWFCVLRSVRAAPPAHEDDEKGARSTDAIILEYRRPAVCARRFAVRDEG